MTYNEFLTGDYSRPIKGHGKYSITNKGRIFNSKTGKAIKSSGTHIRLGKKSINVVQALLEAFPDVEFEASLIQSLRGNSFKSSIKKRGVYKVQWNAKGGLNRIYKKFRAVISFKGVKISLGYTVLKKDAEDLYYKAFLKLRGFRPWD